MISSDLLIGEPMAVELDASTLTAIETIRNSPQFIATLGFKEMEGDFLEPRDNHTLTLDGIASEAHFDDLLQQCSERKTDQGLPALLALYHTPSHSQLSDAMDVLQTISLEARARAQDQIDTINNIDHINPIDPIDPMGTTDHGGNQDGKSHQENTVTPSGLATLATLEGPDSSPLLSGPLGEQVEWWRSNHQDSHLWFSDTKGLWLELLSSSNELNIKAWMDGTHLAQASISLVDGQEYITGERGSCVSCHETGCDRARAALETLEFCAVRSMPSDPPSFCRRVILKFR